MNETVDQGHLRPPPGRLFRKYLYSIVTLAFAALAINTSFDVWFSYREQKQLLAATQREQAASAAIQIGQFIGQIENQIRWLARLPAELSTNEDVRLNAIRLMRLSPAIAELTELDAQGQAFHDPQADAALFRALEQTVRQTASRQLIKVRRHINDPEFSSAVVAAFRALHGQAGIRKRAAR